MIVIRRNIKKVFLIQYYTHNTSFRCISMFLNLCLIFIIFTSIQSYIFSTPPILDLKRIECDGSPKSLFDRRVRTENLSYHPGYQEMSLLSSLSSV